MKKILIVLSTIAGLLYVSSCSNDFELIADWKDIPVIYGVLSRTDTALYVRVEKAYLDPETSALAIAKIPDSIYYPNATVKLVRLQTNTEYVFNKIDGNKDGYPRDEGIFADSPNWLYKLKLEGGDELVEGDKYELIVKRDETSIPVTATAIIVGDLEIKEPSATESLKFEYDRKTDFRWTFDKNSAKFFDAFLHFHYIEIINGVEEEKSFTWQLVSNGTVENTVSYEIKIQGEEFYQTVASRIDASVNVPREFDFIELEVIAGGQEFYDYLQVNNANRGLTSSQVIPNYTNFTEGYGLFASVNKVKVSKFLELTTRDSLIGGIYTRNLNFQD